MTLADFKVLCVQILRFNIVGLTTVALGAAIFFALIWLNVSYVAALFFDYAAGAVFSYFANKNFTFRVKVDSEVSSFSKTVLVYFSSFLLNTLFLGFAVETLKFPVIESQIVIIFILAVVNFIVFRWVIFQAARSVPTESEH